MKKDEWGFSLPLTSPLYPPPPYYWIGTEAIMVHFLAEEGVVRSLLPEPLGYHSNEVIAWISQVSNSTMGQVDEATLYLTCSFDGTRGIYEPYIFVNHEVPFAQGREMMGWAKKLARISLFSEAELVRGELIRAGTKLMSLTVTREAPATLDDLPFGPEFIVKLIPSAEEGAPPEVAQLIRWEGEFTPRPQEFFRGRGSVVFEKSHIDPLYRLEPEKVIAGYYGIFDIVLPAGKIVHRY
jgi:acetoacetate decarboxylase